MTMRLLSMVAGVVLIAGHAAADEAPLLKTDADSVNYAIGVSLINNFRQQGVDIDLPLVIRGMQDAQAGKGLLLDDAALTRASKEYLAAVRQKQSMMARTGPATANRVVGEKFLQENAKKKGVITLPSGLQYLPLNDGSGQRPKEGDSVEYTFRASFLNGKKAGHASADGKASVFKNKEDAIPAIAEALRMMRPGAKWRLFVPSSLAFGDKGDGGLIGPNTALIYDVELLRILE